MAPPPERGPAQALGQPGDVGHVAVEQLGPGGRPLHRVRGHDLQRHAVHRRRVVGDGVAALGPVGDDGEALDGPDVGLEAVEHGVGHRLGRGQLGRRRGRLAAARGVGDQQGQDECGANHGTGGRGGPREATPRPSGLALNLRASDAAPRPVFPPRRPTCRSATSSTRPRPFGRCSRPTSARPAAPASRPSWRRAPSAWSRCLEGLVDPGNVNAVLRSAEGLGFGAAHVVALEDAAADWLRQLDAGDETAADRRASRRASQGAHKWVEVGSWDGPAAYVAWVHRQGGRVAVTALRDDALAVEDWDFTVPTALVVGNEHAGASEAMIEAADAALLSPARRVRPELQRLRRGGPRPLARPRRPPGPRRPPRGPGRRAPAAPRGPLHRPGPCRWRRPLLAEHARRTG